MGLFDTINPFASKEEKEEAAKLNNLTRYHKNVVEPMWRDIGIIFNGGKIPHGSQFEGLNTEQIKDKISEFIVERYKDVEDFVKYIKYLDKLGHSKDLSEDARKEYLKSVEAGKIYLKEVCRNLNNMTEMMETHVSNSYNSGKQRVASSYGKSLVRKAKIMTAKDNAREALKKDYTLLDLEQHKTKFYPAMMKNALSNERTGMHSFNMSTIMIAPVQTSSNNKR